MKELEDAKKWVNEFEQVHKETTGMGFALGQKQFLITAHKAGAKAATDRAVKIAEDESLFASDDMWGDASEKIAAKIRGEK